MRKLTSAVWLGLALWAGPAAAHAVLVATEPADRAVLAAAPTAVVLRFNEPVVAVAAQILDREGRRLAVEMRGENDGMQLALPRDLSPGAYVVSWRVTSADSHPIAGSLMFAIGAEPAAWTDAEAGESSLWPSLLAVARAILSTALLIAAGGALYGLLVAQTSSLARPLAVVAIVGIATAVPVLGLHGTVLRGGAFTDLETWRLGAATSRGASIGVAILGLALLAIGSTQRSRPALWLGAALALASAGLSGHTATASPRWLLAPMLVLHVAVAALWIGSLSPLIVALGRPDPATPVERFSQIAFVAVPVLVAVGSILSIAQLRTWSAIAETEYGTLLLIKLMLVLTLLAMATVNRVWLTPRLPASAGTMRLVVGGELALGVAVIAVSALLSQTLPPRSAAAQATHDHRHGIVAQVQDRGRKAEVEITPAAPGRNLVVVRLDLSSEPKEVVLELSLKSAGIEPLRRVLQPDNGAYVLDGPELSVAGNWTVRLDVLIDDFEKAIFETEVPIR